MLARDDFLNSYDLNSFNYYGVHPFYLGLEPSGKAHGVFIFNSNSQEVTTGPAPHLIYRTIGGQLDLYFFPGPSPEDVVRQYQQLIGKPFLPAYWAFGYQFCRWGYEGVDEVRSTIKRIVDAKIPLDVVYADGSKYMDKFKPFTYDLKSWSTLPELAQELHKKEMRMILLFDPAPEVDTDVFKRALDMNVSFIEWPTQDLVPTDVQSLYPLTKNTRIMLGVVWPFAHVAFPDFLDPSLATNKWWTNEFVDFRKKVAFDGAWIDMNEPALFGTNAEHYFNNDTGLPYHPDIKPLICPTSSTDKYSYLDVPPYETACVYQRRSVKGGEKETLSSRSLCMLARSKRGTQNFYDTRSLYGWSEARATSEAIKLATGKRGVVISRSTFPSSGSYTGHWLGDNNARIEDLRTSIIGVQEFNLFGIPYVGSDVCGFTGPTTEDLCLRWQQLGAFHSFYRNHNRINEPLQDPPQWPSVSTATRVANLFRYQHLPFLYSLHFKASLYGGTVIRPVFFEFPNDPITHSLSYQFMWGSQIMVMPVIYLNVSSIRGYLPPQSKWYSMSSAFQYGKVAPNGYSLFTAPRDTPLPAFVRAGTIIPRQKPGLTTAESRQNPLELLVALSVQNSSTPNYTQLKADGELYWDDGESLFSSIETSEYYHLQFSVEVYFDQFSNCSTFSTILINCTKSPLLKPHFKLPFLDKIEIFGYPHKPDVNSTLLNGHPFSFSFSYDPLKHILVISPQMSINLNREGPVWKLSWGEPLASELSNAHPKYLYSKYSLKLAYFIFVYLFCINNIIFNQ